MATHNHEHEALNFNAVNATPIDGVTTGRTRQAIDRVKDQSFLLANNEIGGGRLDIASLIIWALGNAGDSVAFKIWGYRERGPAEIIGSATGVLGTAKASDTELYVHSLSVSDFSGHSLTVGIKDSGDNGILRIDFDNAGYNYIVVEPITFTGLSDVSFQLREYGMKNS